ncbi:hypothetical protein FRC01_007570 [Tulasnella sp. 417]|nr:hypothetical protein FRC01_007570 [Tulasnella sp. 417]
MSVSNSNLEEATTPAVNLYAYAASAIPPKMAREMHLTAGEPPRGDFWIDTKVPRALIEIQQIHRDLISDRAQKYHIPAEEIPEPSASALDDLALPGKNHPRGNPNTLTQFGQMARNMQDVGRWIDRMVLNTASAMLQLINPYDGWVAVPERRTRMRADDTDPMIGEDTIECEINIMRRQISAQNIYQPHLVVFTFPPWKVAPSDFHDFSMPHRFDPTLTGPLAADRESTQLTRKEKMWYYIYDVCLAHNCRWFAITSADYWCFGVFGAGWTGGYTSPPLPYFNRHPTVLQILILWTMSSLYENHPETRFVIPLRFIDIIAAESVIDGGEDHMLEAANYRHLIQDSQEETPTEVDEREVAGGLHAETSGVLDGNLNTGAVITRWGGLESGSINFVHDQPRQPSADRSSFRQAVLANSPSRTRASHRFAPYPLPSSQAQRESSRAPLSPVEESDDTFGNATAGPSGRVDKGKGRAIPAPADLEEALPTTSNALSKTASAPASVLSAAFRTRPRMAFNGRTAEKGKGKQRLSTEGAAANDETTAGPSGWGRSSGISTTRPTKSGTAASAETPRRGNSFLEHRSSVLTVTPSSPVAGPSFDCRGGVAEEEEDDVANATG